MPDGPVVVYNETHTMKKTAGKKGESLQSRVRTSVLFVPIMIIVLASFAVYFNALFNGFVYDDKQQVVDNIWIRDIGSMPEIFTQSVWGFAKEVEDQGVANYYRPLMHVVYMASYYLFGLKPWGFHLVNILFHGGVSVLVFLVLSRLLNRASSALPTAAPPPATSVLSPAFIAALLFATHPIHTEAVTWVAGLPEVSYTFFYLLAFYCYMRSREVVPSPSSPLTTTEEQDGGSRSVKKEGRENVSKERGNKKGGTGKVGTKLPAGRENRDVFWYVLSLVSFSFSLLFKEPALTLPVMLLVYDLLCKRMKISTAELLRRDLPFAVISGVYLLLRLNALKSMVPTETMAGLSFSQSVINVFPLFTAYLKDLVFPFNLMFWHTFRPLETLFSAEGLLSLLVAGAFAAAVVVSWKRDRTILLGLLFIVVPLLPAFYIKGIGSKPYAERYLYLSSFGFVMLIAVALPWLRRKAPRYGLAATIAALALTGAYSLQTIARNPAWKNDFTFYEDTIRKSPDTVPLHIAYGVALSDVGRIDEAIEQYQTAIKLGPNYWQAYENLGIAYGKQGQLDKAIEQMETALSLGPKSAVTRSNLGLAYMRQGAIDKAIEQFLVSVKLNPNFFQAHFNLANAYEEKGLLDKAMEEYETVVRLRPDHAETYYLLFRMYASSGRRDDAIRSLGAASALRPDNASYHNTLGVLYGQKGLYDDAVAQFDAAIRLAPDNASYRANREKALGLKK